MYIVDEQKKNVYYEGRILIIRGIDQRDAQSDHLQEGRNYEHTRIEEDCE